MDRKEMLDKIHEKIADKSISNGCMVSDAVGNIWVLYDGATYIETDRDWNQEKGERESYNFVYDWNYGKTCNQNGVTIIGHPITLNRLMYELEKYDFENANNELQFSYLKGNIIYTEYCNDGQGFYNSIPWKLVNDDGTDATLMDQNDATIVKLYNLLCD